MKLLANRGQLDVVHGGATLFEATDRRWSCEAGKTPLQRQRSAARRPNW